MAWEVFERDRVVSGEPTATITKMGRISLNKIAALTFADKKAEYAELLWDKETHSVGVRNSEKKKGVFRLSYGDNGNGVGFSCSTFLNYIRYDWTQSRNFPAQWDASEQMFFFQIPAEHIGKPVPEGYQGRRGTVMRADRRNRAESKDNANTGAV